MSETSYYCHDCFAAYNRERRKGPAGERDRENNRRYKRANRVRCSERERLRKAKLVGPALDREKIYGDGICGICGEPVEYDDFEVDHIIALAKGGSHSYENTQPAHSICNRRKYV